MAGEINHFFFSTVTDKISLSFAHNNFYFSEETILENHSLSFLPAVLEVELLYIW